MKITDVTVCKEEMTDGEIGIALRCTHEDGTQIASAIPWRNRLGFWASDSDARDPAEIVAVLRAFADAIERHAAKAKAAELAC